MIKYMTLIKRKSNLSHEEFCRYWKDKHAPLSARVVPGMKKYIQNHLVRLRGEKCEVDGIAELWFDDLEAYRAFLAWRKTEEAKVLIEDEDKFVDGSNSTGYIVEEYLIK